CTLSDLDRDETERYIHHRLNVAGSHGDFRFTAPALNALFRASHGVPRLINLICDRALLAGYAARTREIGPKHVRKAVTALTGDDKGDVAALRPGPRHRTLTYVVASVTVAVPIVAGILLLPGRI